MSEKNGQSRNLPESEHCPEEDTAAILKEYQQQNPADAIMGRMLLNLMALERGMDEALGLAKKEPAAKDRIACINIVARLAKQQLAILQAIAKYQEIYHAATKKARGNRSAAPGQQVGQTVQVAPISTTLNN
jgi:hypothetical protein